MNTQQPMPIASTNIEIPQSVQNIGNNITDSVNNLTESVKSSLDGFSQQVDNVGDASSGFLSSNTLIAKFVFLIFILIVFLFLMNLGILAIQYLISLMFKNFLVPVGIGLVGLIGSMIGLSWDYIFLSPYSYCAMQVVPIKRDFNLHVYGLVYFAIISVISYILYIRKKEKG